MLKIYKQTTTVKEEKNEDACSISSSAATLSDGAGGCGIFCGDWAAFLCDLFLGKVPSDTSEINQAIESRYQQFTSAIERMDSASGAIDKFYREGSYATLASVAFDADVSHFDVCTYGDSPVFHYREGRFDLLSSCHSLSAFTENPHLLNWISETENSKEFFAAQHIAFTGSNKLLLTSDALGQLILSLCLVIRAMQGDEEAKSELSRTLATPTKLAAAVQLILKAYIEGDKTEAVIPLNLISKNSNLSNKQIAWGYKYLTKNSNKSKIPSFAFFQNKMRNIIQPEFISMLPETEAELASLLAHLSGDEALFTRCMKKYYEAGFLLRDDYTLVVIEKKAKNKNR